jgi:hypothetical protein
MLKDYGPTTRLLAATALVVVVLIAGMSLTA